MFKVFAIEPEFLVDHPGCIRKDDFGFDKGRLFGHVPKGWAKKVKELCRTRNSLQGESERQLTTHDMKLIEALVLHLQYSGKVELPRRTLESSDSWLSTACSLDDNILDGIVVAKKPEGHSDNRLVTRDDIYGLSDFRSNTWASEASADCIREVNEMTAKITNLLRYSRVIHFIEPYFDPDQPRFMEVLKKSLEIISRTEKEAKVVLNFKYGGRGTAILEPVRRFDHIQDRTKDHLSRSRLLPNHLNLVFRQWSETDEGERFHERFIVTEKGGVEFGGGLDTAPSQKETTTVTRLAECQRDERFTWFDPETNPPVYKLLNATD